MVKRRNLTIIAGYLVFIILLTLGVSHCDGQTVDDYYNLFVVDAKAQGKALVRVPPTFVQTSDNLYLNIGGVHTEVSAYTQHKEKKIYINVVSFEYETNPQVLIYHELGHYYLRRNHTDRKSIMNINMWGWGGLVWDEMSTNHQQFYIDELFK